MRVFVTGASGFIGSAVVRELLGAGHQVIGLARSDASAEAIAATGAEVLRGSLNDLDSLRRGAADVDGVIHTAFIHDFSNYAAAAEADRSAIETLGEVLADSNRPFVVSSGMAGGVSEDDTAPAGVPRFSEQTALALASRGVRVSVMRLPPSVHGEGDHGFISALIGIARAKGVSGYPGDGANYWPSVHRLDAAHLFRLALESAPAGSRLHAVADEGVPFRDIAGVIGQHLNLPVVSVSSEDADNHFGWMARFASIDVTASSTLTRQRMEWQPTQPGLIDDLDQGHYFN